MRTNKILPFLILIVFIPLFGFGIESSKFVAGNAIVYKLDRTREFYAPVCTGYFEHKNELIQTTYSEAIKIGYKSNSDCRNEGAFFQDDRSLTGQYLQDWGFLNPLPSRWTSEGEWNW